MQPRLACPAGGSVLTGFAAEEGEGFPWGGASPEPGEGRQSLLQPHLEPRMCCIPPLQPAPFRDFLPASLFVAFLSSHVAYLLPEWCSIIIFNLGSCLLFPPGRMLVALIPLRIGAVVGSSAARNGRGPFLSVPSCNGCKHIP